MSVVINPIIRNHKFFEPTAERVSNLFSPIQETNSKHSDVAAYLLTPVIDMFVLEPVFAIDASIHLLNAFASLCNAAYLWTINQYKSPSLIDGHTNYALKESVHHSLASISAILAQTVNSILSILALVTRPIASIVHACSSDDITSKTKATNADIMVSF